MLYKQRGGDMLLFWGLFWKMLFPNRESSVVFVVGRMFPGANPMSTESTSSTGPYSPSSLGMDRTVSNVSVLPVVQKVAFSFHSGGQHYFQYVIWRGKKEKEKEKVPIALWSLPSLTDPQGQSHYTVVRSEVIQYKVKKKEKGDSSFRIPSRDQRRLRTGWCLRGSTVEHRSIHTLDWSFTLDPADDEIFEKHSDVYMWAIFLQALSMKKELGLYFNCKDQYTAQVRNVAGGRSKCTCNFCS